MRTILYAFMHFLCTTGISGQTWVRQNPFPTLGVMQDFDFDGDIGIAVGSESTMFITTNGGTNWIPSKPPQESSYIQAALIVPGTGGQLMLAGGYNLIISHDGGHTWQYTTAPVQLAYKIQALDDGSIIALDLLSGFRSVDQGVTWEPINMPGINITAGHFTSALNGWVQSGGFENNQVWVTTDGGVTWNLRDPLKHPIILAIEMLNDQVGFIGARDFVYKTIDGGNSWIKLNASQAVNSITDLHVVNENELWASENNGAVFFSLDGGMNWTDINPNIISSNQTYGIYANAGGEVWLAGKFVSILYSNDAAMSWTDQIPNAKTIMYQPYFYDENIGLVGSSEGTMLKTTNGGASWNRIQLDPDENFFAVQMISDQTMVAGSSSGKIFSTTNQGTTWGTMGQGLGQIKDIYASSLQTAIVISENGQINKTVDGGVQWDVVYSSGTSELLTGMDFINDEEGWVCGWFGRILHTEDGGQNWESQFFDKSQHFEAIDFINEEEGWVVKSGFSDTSWHTVNGGVDWTAVPLPYLTFWHGVSFTNQDTGWIAGGSAGYGIILRTNDGGQTWVLDHQSPEAFFGIYAVPEKETVWACGVGGNIVKYSPCTFQPAIDQLAGDLTPCQRDTVTYSVNSTDVDIFEWTFPSDWIVLGNSNTSSIQFIIGSMQGMVGIVGKDACDNITTPLSLNANPVPVTDVLIDYHSDGFLFSDQTEGQYQWLRNGNAINGANGPTYTVTQGGEYELVHTNINTGCEDRSNLIEIIIDGVRDINSTDLNVFPNPVRGVMTFQFTNGESIQDGAVLSIYNLVGQVKMKQKIFTNEIDVRSLSEGMYLVEIQVANKIYQRKIMVL